MGALQRAMAKKPQGGPKHNTGGDYGMGGPKGPGNRITEDDPRWNPKTMGNHRGTLHPKKRH